MDIVYKQPDRKRIKEIDDALRDKSGRKAKKLVKKYFGLWELD